MHSGREFAWALWVTSNLLQLCLCLLIFRRRLFRPLPFFAIYITVSAVGNLAVALLVLYFPGLGLTYMGIYSMEIVAVSALALFAAAEVCSQVVRAYPGAYRSWRTWRTRIFVACGAGLIIFSGWPEAALSRHPTVFWLAQGPNLWITVAAMALIMVIVMICSNYMVPIQVAEGALLLGFAT